MKRSAICILYCLFGKIWNQCSGVHMNKASVTCCVHTDNLLHCLWTVNLNKIQVSFSYRFVSMVKRVEKGFIWHRDNRVGCYDTQHCSCRSIWCTSFLYSQVTVFVLKLRHLSQKYQKFCCFPENTVPGFPYKTASRA